MGFTTKTIQYGEGSETGTKWVVNDQKTNTKKQIKSKLKF